MLTDKQILEAKMFFNKHSKVIKDKVRMTEKSFIPKLEYYKNNPAVWKPEYWKWFLNSGL